MSLNKVMLIGHVGQDPEVRYIGAAGDNNTKVAMFGLATSERYRDRNGEIQERTEWHGIVAWRGLADIAERYIRKGSQVFIIGHLAYRVYTDNAGNKKNVTDIVADKIELCGGKQDSQPSSRPAPAPPQKFDPHAVKTTPIVDDLPPDDDGLPFRET